LEEILPLGDKKESDMTHRKGFLCGKKIVPKSPDYLRKIICHPILDGSFISNLVVKI
jgi:hypothetical protein